MPQASSPLNQYFKRAYVKTSASRASFFEAYVYWLFELVLMEFAIPSRPYNFKGNLMVKKFWFLAAAVSALTLSLSGCGGGGSKASSLPTSTPLEVQPRTATFVDSPVSGVTARSGVGGTYVSKTREDGTFEFIPGTPVEFSIGRMVLGTAEPSNLALSGLVTPLSLDNNTSDDASPKATNLLRMLQTLDLDGDPSNGITITEKMSAVAQEVDFNQAVSAFESNPRVASALSLMANAEGIPPRDLVAAEAARAHFRATMVKRFGGVYKLWFGQPTDATTAIIRMELSSSAVSVTGVGKNGDVLESAQFDEQGNIKVTCLPRHSTQPEPMVCLTMKVTRYSGSALHGVYTDLVNSETGTWDAAVDGPYFVTLRDPKVAVLQFETPEKHSMGLVTWSFVNTTSHPQTPAAINVNGSFPALYSVGGTCKAGSAVSPGRSCTVTVTFHKADYCAQGSLRATVTSELGAGVGREAVVAHENCRVER